MIEFAGGGKASSDYISEITDIDWLWSLFSSIGVGKSVIDVNAS